MMTPNLSCSGQQLTKRNLVRNFAQSYADSWRIISFNLYVIIQKIDILMLQSKNVRLFFFHNRFPNMPTWLACQPKLGVGDVSSDQSGSLVSMRKEQYSCCLVLDCPRKWTEWIKYATIVPNYEHCRHLVVYYNKVCVMYFGIKSSKFCYPIQYHRGFWEQ